MSVRISYLVPHFSVFTLDLSRLALEFDELLVAFAKISRETHIDTRELISRLREKRERDRERERERETSNPHPKSMELKTLDN